MPFGFDKLYNHISKSEKPDKLGEEGILHLIQMGDKRYYAKEWYAIGEKQLMISKEHNASPASPYWGKLKYYEYALIHDIFPNNTVKLVASSDARISKNEEGKWEFNHEKGRPITVTEEIKGDPELTAKRDEIIDDAYEKMHAYHEKTGRGRYASADERVEFYRIVMQADEEIQKEFGKELHLPIFDTRSPTEEIERLLSGARKVNPNSTIVSLLRYGIVPLHSEFNFIPEKPDKNKAKPQGSFIELKMVDPARFVKHAKETGAKYNVVSLHKFIIYRNLDAFYDSIMHPSKKLGGLRYKPEAETALFHILEEIRRKFQMNPRIIENEFIKIVDKVDQAYLSSVDMPTLVKSLKTAEEYVISLK